MSHGVVDFDLNRWNGVAVAGQQRNSIDPVLDCQKRHVDAHHYVDTLLGMVLTAVFFAPLLTRVIRGNSPRSRLGTCGRSFAGSPVLVFACSAAAAIAPIVGKSSP